MAIKDLVPRFGRGREHVPVRRGEYDPFRDCQRDMNRLFTVTVPKREEEQARRKAITIESA